MPFTSLVVGQIITCFFIFMYLKHNANLLEKGGNYGNQATVHLPGTCQHITEKNQSVECIITLKYGRSGKRSKLAHGNALANLPGVPQIS